MGQNIVKTSQKWVFLAQNDELGDFGSICFWSKFCQKSRFLTPLPLGQRRSPKAEPKEAIAQRRVETLGPNFTG